jgi:hypothetical protein
LLTVKLDRRERGNKEGIISTWQWNEEQKWKKFIYEKKKEQNIQHVQCLHTMRTCPVTVTASSFYRMIYKMQSSLHPNNDQTAMQNITTCLTYKALHIYKFNHLYNFDKQKTYMPMEYSPCILLKKCQHNIQLHFPQKIWYSKHLLACYSLFWRIHNERNINICMQFKSDIWVAATEHWQTVRLYMNRVFLLNIFSKVIPLYLQTQGQKIISFSLLTSTKSMYLLLKIQETWGYQNW